MTGSEGSKTVGENPKLSDSAKEENHTNQNHKVDRPAKEVLAVVRRRWKLVLVIMLVDLLIKFLVKFMALRKSAWLAQRDAAAAVIPEMVFSATPTTSIVTRMVILNVADGATSTACVLEFR